MESTQPHSAPSTATPVPTETVQVTVLGDVEAYFAIPMNRVVQMPVNLLPVETLVLCPYFNALWRDSCPMGTACRLVHANTSGLNATEVHVNYAWRSMEEVEYPRHTAGETLHVAAPNSQVPTDTMDSSCLLVTKALASKRRPLTHCAHYYFNRQCNLGADCRFVHAIFLDPDATFRRRAPAPVQLGRGTVSQPVTEDTKPVTQDGPSAPSTNVAAKRVSTPDSEHRAGSKSDSPASFTSEPELHDPAQATHSELNATVHSTSSTPMKGRRHVPYAVKVEPVAAASV